MTSERASAPNADKAVPANFYASDGYRYGVMFGDGSVGEWYNGESQRQRAEEEARAIVDEQLAKYGRHDHISVARRLPGGPWERLKSPVRKGKADDI